jgi:hypothetical protein
VTWPYDITMMQLMAALVPDRLVSHILAAIEADATAPLLPQAADSDEVAPAFQSQGQVIS